MPKARAVPRRGKHMIHRGDDGMPPKYAATYQFGKSTVNIVAPQPMTEEEEKKLWDEIYRAAWACWETIPREKQMQINAEYDNAG